MAEQLEFKNCDTATVFAEVPAGIMMAPYGSSDRMQSRLRPQ
jgi:hypothetical protein